jgi:uncharacterized membrane protein
MRPGLTIAVAAAVAGIGISAYLTVVHYSAAPLVCSASGTVNCEAVLTSPYGVLLGSSVPTSAAGILWFAVALCLGAVRLAADGTALARAHLLWAAGGLVFVLGLVYIEIDRIGAICVWCTAADVCVLVTLLATIWARR